MKMGIFQEKRALFKDLCEQEAGDNLVCQSVGSERTCESLSARVDPSQPLGCAKIWYLQDATVGVDEYIVTLRI